MITCYFLEENGLDKIELQKQVHAAKSVPVGSKFCETWWMMEYSYIAVLVWQCAVVLDFCIIFFFSVNFLELFLEYLYTVSWNSFKDLTPSLFYMFMI